MSHWQYILSFLKSTNLYQLIIKEILRNLYHYNHRVEYWDLDSRPKPVQTTGSLSSDFESTAVSHVNNNSSQSKSIHNWGGALIRLALQAIYTLAFICLLRSDEVLKIHRDHIEFVKDDDNSEYMVLTLPFRKTHQDGRKSSHLFSWSVV